MSIETMFETDNYRWDWDRLAGVGWFVRKADDHVSLMETGIEADALSVTYSFYIKDDPKNVASFEKEAEAQEYSPRWGRDGAKISYRPRPYIEREEDA